MRVQLPDGKIAEFPDSMSHAEVEAIIKDQYLDPGREVSAVTAKSVPTIEEKVQGSKNAIAKSLPIAGDIAGTMIGGGAASVLPKLGMKVLPKILPVLGRAAGSAAGSYAGSYGEQKMEGREFNPREAELQAIMGGGIELGSAALKPAIKPALDFMSDFTVAGRQVKNVWRDRIIKKTTEAAKTFMEGLKPSMIKEEAGKAVGSELKSMTDFKTVYKDYNELLASHEGPVDLGNTHEFLSKLRDKIKGKIGDAKRPIMNNKLAAEFDLDPKGRKVLRQIIGDAFPLSGDEKQMLVDGVSSTATAKDVQYLLGKVWKDFKGMTPAEKELAEGLKSSLIKDLEFLKSSSGATAAELKTKADAVFSKANEWFKENPTAKRITTNMRTQAGSYYEAFPEKSLDQIFSAEPKEIARIRYQVTKTPEGEKAWTAGVFNRVREIYESNMTKDAATGAGQMKVQPLGLADDLEKNLPALRMMDSEVAKNVEKEIKYYRAIGPEFVKREKPAFPQLTGTAVAGYLGGAPAVAVTEGFGVASALTVMSPTARKIIGGMAKTAAKAGGHLALPMMPAH